MRTKWKDFAFFSYFNFQVPQIQKYKATLFFSSTKQNPKTSNDTGDDVVRWNVDARNSTRSQPKFDPRQRPRRSEVAFIEFGSRARKCQRLAPISESLVLSYSRLSFFARLPNRLFIVRYLRARNLEKRIVLSGGGSKGRIPLVRITHRRCLLSISFLDEKIVLRARFGSITAQKAAENDCAIRMLTTEFIGNGM